MFHHSISYISFTLITQLPYAFQPWLHGYMAPISPTLRPPNALTGPFAEWWRRSQGAGATQQIPASHLHARGCLHQWHRQQPAGPKNHWPSNIGPRHLDNLDQSKRKSSCFFLNVIQLLMHCVWHSWQDSAVKPPKAPWKQGGSRGKGKRCHFTKTSSLVLSKVKKEVFSKDQLQW